MTSVPLFSPLGLATDVESRPGNTLMKIERRPR